MNSKIIIIIAISILLLLLPSMFYNIRHLHCLNIKSNKQNHVHFVILLTTATDILVHIKLYPIFTEFLENLFIIRKTQQFGWFHSMKDVVVIGLTSHVLLVVLKQQLTIKKNVNDNSYRSYICINHMFLVHLIFTFTVY